MKSIALCGSMDFSPRMDMLADELRSRGLDVFVPEPEEMKVDYTAITDSDLAEAKSAFIDEHLRKIEVSDAILVVNMTKRDIDGYVGPNTLMEMAFAYVLRKRIYVLNSFGAQSCRPELLGMKPIVLSGNLEQLFR